MENQFANDNRCSSTDVIKSIALKLKHYIANKRREDGFDLSPAPLPQRTYPNLLPRPMLQASLQDLPLKHHFSHRQVRGTIARLQSSKFSFCHQENNRLKQINVAISRVMKNPCSPLFANGANSQNRISTTASPPKQNLKNNTKVFTRVPPPTCSSQERERIVGFASHLMEFIERASATKCVHKDIGCTKIQRLSQPSTIQAPIIPQIHRDFVFMSPHCEKVPSSQLTNGGQPS